MARGWESKAIESQIEDRQNARMIRGPRLSPEQRQRAEKKADLERSRIRVLREMEAARVPQHRATLELALAYLDTEIQKLSDS